MTQGNLYLNSNVDANMDFAEELLRKLPSLPPLQTLSINTRVTQTSVESLDTPSSDSSEEFVSPQVSVDRKLPDLPEAPPKAHASKPLGHHRTYDQPQYQSRLNKTPSVKSSVSAFKAGRVTPGFRPKPPPLNAHVTPTSPSSRTPDTPSHSSNARKFQNFSNSTHFDHKPKQYTRNLKASSHSDQDNQDILPPRTESLVSSLECISPVPTTDVQTSEFIDFVHNETMLSPQMTPPSMSLNNKNTYINTTYTSTGAQYFNKSASYSALYPLNILQKPRPPVPEKRTSSNPSVGSNPDLIQSRYSSSTYTFSQTTPTMRTVSNGEVRKSSVSSITGIKPSQQIPNVTVPTTPFSIDLIGEDKLAECHSVHKVSSVYKWLLKVYFEWFNDYIFYKFDFFELVQLLLEYKLSKFFDQDTIDSNVDKMIESLIIQHAVRFVTDLESQEQVENTDETNDELTIIAAGMDVSGIFTGLTKCISCCFSENKNKCYSYICSNSVSCTTEGDLQDENVPNINAEKATQSSKTNVVQKSIEVWSDYWNLSTEDLNNINPREIKRQSFIFDLFILEERSLNLANAALNIYGQKFNANLLPNEPDFHTIAFDIFISLVELHSNYLLTPLYNKLETKGKFIDGVGKICLKWVHEATNIYTRYAENMAIVHEVIDWEKKQTNSIFYQWLKQMDNSPDISRSKIYHDVIFFGGFFKSLQNMPITLTSILKNTERSSEDYDYLNMAIEEIVNLNSLVDKTMGDSADRRRIIRLSKQLVITKSMGNMHTNNISNSDPSTGSLVDNDGILNNSKAEFVNISDRLDLRLNEKSRKLLKEGVLLKKRDLWIEPSSVNVFLLDNYFLITEVLTKNSNTNYKLVERPIPIDYLSLETKNSALETPTSATMRPSLQHTASGKIFSLQQKFMSGEDASQSDHQFLGHHQGLSNGSNGRDGEQDQGQYSFKIRNTATNESHTLISTKYEDYKSWLSSIVEVLKTHNTDKNQTQVFKLECLNDMFLFHEKNAPTSLPVAAEGSALEIALQNYYVNGIEPQLNGIKSNVLCSVKFKYEGKTFVLCAVTNGVYMSEIKGSSEKSQHGWKLILKVSNIKKMETSASMDLLFVLYDKKLSYFSLPSILLAFYNSKKYLEGKGLIGIFINDRVSNFCLAENFENSRQLVYERKGYIYFATPEFDRMNKAIRFFKFYKAFKLPGNVSLSSSFHAQNNFINVFTKSFLVCSSDEGCLLFNDSFNDTGLKLPIFPDATETQKPAGDFYNNKLALESDAQSTQGNIILDVISDIKTNKTKPISCFKLKNGDFIIVYDEAVVKMNRNGFVENGQRDILVLDFYCNDCSISNEFLILCGENLIQIYDFSAENINSTPLYKLMPVQIIKGKRINLINSQKEEDAVICISHPWIAGRQLILGFYS